MRGTLGCRKQLGGCHVLRVGGSDGVGILRDRRHILRVVDLLEVRLARAVGRLALHHQARDEQDDEEGQSGCTDPNEPGVAGIVARVVVGDVRAVERNRRREGGHVPPQSDDHTSQDRRDRRESDEPTRKVLRLDLDLDVAHVVRQLPVGDCELVVRGAEGVHLRIDLVDTSAKTGELLGDRGVQLDEATVDDLLELCAVAFVREHVVLVRADVLDLGLDVFDHLVQSRDLVGDARNLALEAKSLKLVDSQVASFDVLRDDSLQLGDGESRRRGLLLVLSHDELLLFCGRQIPSIE